jgi:hypothetical protein
MLVEHTFVTTASEDKALSALFLFLSGMGFSAKSGTAPDAQAGGPKRVEMSRGTRDTRDLSTTAQKLSVEYDRGRVTLAISMQPRGKPRGFTFAVSSYDFIVTPTSPQGQYCIRVMMSLAERIEAVACLQQSPEEAMLAWDGVIKQASLEYRKAQGVSCRGGCIWVAVIFFLAVGLCILLMVAMQKHWLH